ncbi:MAG: protoporphyrinogen oxidase [Polyangiaceae bacterium]
MSEARRLVIIGGGITGLAAARAAQQQARERASAVSVTLLEASPRLGGNLITERTGGFVLDAGPDSWVRAKPHASALARDLGLGGSLVGTSEEARRYFIAWAGRLHPVPEGLVLGVPTRLGPLAAAGLFSWRGKLRMALEPLVSARAFDGDDDESIADFAARRLGREAAERLVAPLLGGISAGDASDLSVRAAFPQLVAMERDHGSLVGGMRAARRAREESGANETSAFESLVGGVGDLVEALVDRLRTDGVTLCVSAKVTRVGREGPSWVVETETGERLIADAILLATGAPAAASVLGQLDAGVGQMLSSLSFASTATVFLGYRRSDVRHPLIGSGFLVPRALGRPILAGTWVSSKWRGRAPEGHVLLRAFVGGARGEEVLARDDKALVRLARDELCVLMGLDAEPVLSRVFRFTRKSPQMRVGHLARMRALHDRVALLAPGVRLAGGGYDGIGIPDCIRQGQEAGRAMTAR